MKRWSVGVVNVIIVGLGVVLAPATAGAGGWAVSTLDPMTAPVAGATTAVGFTIRQHGVRAIKPDGRVGIDVKSAAGFEQFFPGTARGATGHYVAHVRFPEPGAYRWSIRQGSWFKFQDLGRIAVTGAGAAAASVGRAGGRDPGTTYRGSLAMRILLPALGIGLGALALGDAVRTRRRRSQELIAT